MLSNVRKVVCLARLGAVVQIFLFGIVLFPGGACGEVILSAASAMPHLLRALCVVLSGGAGRVWRGSGPRWLMFEDIRGRRPPWPWICGDAFRRSYGA